MPACGSLSVLRRLACVRAPASCLRTRPASGCPVCLDLAHLTDPCLDVLRHEEPRCSLAECLDRADDAVTATQPVARAVARGELSGRCLAAACGSPRGLRHDSSVETFVDQHYQSRSTTSKRSRLQKARQRRLCVRCYRFARPTNGNNATTRPSPLGGAAKLLLRAWCAAVDRGSALGVKLARRIFGPLSGPSQAPSQQACQ